LLSNLDVIFNFVLFKPNLLSVGYFEKLYRREEKTFPIQIFYKEIKKKKSTDISTVTEGKKFPLEFIFLFRDEKSKLKYLII